MGFLTGILGMFTGASGGWIAYAAIIAGLLGAGAYGGHWAQETIDAPKITTAQAATTKALADLEVEKQNLAQANANIAALQTSLTADNSDIAQWKAAADKASQQAAQAQAAADKANAADKQRIAALLNAKATGNVCTAALDLIHGAKIQ